MHSHGAHRRSSCWKNFVVGLGARPGRAGSIGRDSPDHGEFADFPSQEAGGASLCPIHGEITASWFQAEWTGAQTMGTLGILVEPSSFKIVYPPVTEWLLFITFFS